MKTFNVALITILASLVAAPCWSMPSVTVTETYDGTIDEATWRVASFDVVRQFGGHPDGYLRVQGLDSPAPRISTVPALAPQFLGDYRAKGVIALGIDISLFSVDITAEGRPVSLYLYSDMGTPDDSLDDCEAVSVGSKNVPRPGTGWKTYDFKVPSQSMTLPQGWVAYGTCAGLTPDEAWNEVITNVGRASFYFGEPEYFYIFQIWDVGFDNPRITLGKGGTGPTLAAEDSAN